MMLRPEFTSSCRRRTDSRDFPNAVVMLSSPGGQRAADFTDPRKGCYAETLKSRAREEIGSGRGTRWASVQFVSRR